MKPIAIYSSRYRVYIDPYSKRIRIYEDSIYKFHKFYKILEIGIKWKNRRKDRFLNVRFLNYGCGGGCELVSNLRQLVLLLFRRIFVSCQKY